MDMMLILWSNDGGYLVRATLTVAPADVYYMLCLMAYTTVRVLSI